MSADAAKYRALILVLRAFGLLDLCALLAVFLPRGVMDSGAAWVGLELGPGPLAGYLARTCSAMYALHGVTVLYVSFDVARYWKLIRLLALAALLHGALVLAIDIFEGMPLWWCVLEGPAIAASGAIVLALQWRATDPNSQ